MAATAGKIKAGQAYIELTTDNSKLLRGLRAAQASLRSFGNTLKTLGTDLVQTAGLISIPLAMTVKSFADFDDRMRAVASLSGMSSSEMQRFGKTVRNLGATTAFTTKQVADGAVALAHMGFKAYEIDNSLRPVMNLVRATGEETHRFSDVAQYASETLNQFRLPASQMTDVVDVLAYASNNSSMNIDDLGQAMKLIAPTANTMGENVRDVSAALMLLANAGIKGTIAGNALKRVYQSLATQSGKTAALSPEEIEEGIRGEEAFAAMGIKMVDSQGKMRKVADIMVDLSKVVRRMQNGEKVNFATDIFDLRGSLAGLSMLSDSFSLKTLRKALNDITGYAKKKADDLEKAIGGILRTIISQIQELGISIGEAIADTFGPWMAKLPKVTNVIRLFINQNKKLIAFLVAQVGIAATAGVAMIALSIPFKVLAPIVGLAATALKIFINTALITANAAIAVAKGIHALTTAFSVARRVITAGIGIAVNFAHAISALVVSIATGWLPMLAFASAVGAAVLVWKSFSDASKYASQANNIKNAFVTAFREIKDVAKESFGIIMESLSAGDLAGAAKVALAAFDVAFREGLKPIRMALDAFGAYFQNFWISLKYNFANFLFDFFTPLRVFFIKFRHGLSVWGNLFGALGKGGFDDEIRANLDKVYEQYKKEMDGVQAYKYDLQQSEKSERFRVGYKNSENEREYQRDINNAKRQYEEAKKFAAQWEVMKKIEKELIEEFNGSQEYFRTNFLQQSEYQEGYLDYYRNLLKDDFDKGEAEVRAAIDWEKNRINTSKAEYERLLEESQADRVITDAEQRAIGEQSFKYGEASELKAQLEKLLAEAMASTGTAMGNKALGNPDAAQKAEGSFSLNALRGMVGGSSPIERVAKATEGSLEVQNRQEKYLRQLAANVVVYQ